MALAGGGQQRACSFYVGRVHGRIGFTGQKKLAYIPVALGRGTVERCLPGKIQSACIGTVDQKQPDRIQTTPACCGVECRISATVLFRVHIATSDFFFQPCDAHIPYGRNQVAHLHNFFERLHVFGAPLF
jgi:hypothetical protein